jgi:hypothetical protein
MSKKIGVTVDQAELIDALMSDKETVIALLTKLDQMVIEMELRALKTPILVDQEKTFIYEKLKSEGARTLYSHIKLFLLPTKKIAKPISFNE